MTHRRHVRAPHITLAIPRHTAHDAGFQVQAERPAKLECALTPHCRKVCVEREVPGITFVRAMPQVRGASVQGHGSVFLHFYYFAEANTDKTAPRQHARTKSTASWGIRHPHKNKKGGQKGMDSSRHRRRWQVPGLGTDVGGMLEVVEDALAKGLHLGLDALLRRCGHAQ